MLLLEKNAMEKLDKFSVDYAPGEIIFCEYEPGNEFYFVKKGRVSIVKIINNREKTLDVLEEGDVFGEMAILEAEPRSASAVAMGPETVSLLKFHRDNFDAILQGNPQLAYRLLVIFSKRIYDAKRRLMILLLNEPQLRVMDVLNMLAEAEQKFDLDSPVILKTNPNEICNWAGLPMEDTQKALTQLANLGKIEIQADSVFVKNIRDFQRLVNSRRKQMFTR
ncbi:MAG TPA: Crp/Fnr family transcriptional regulator [Spirochaetota bacterium]|nr:Crp/Fnr family transcriptional regulator [Spirochaetota bacterium]HPA64270.1 Crp/Fnr family transcriptional regulator [Spirochaetota bacterium]HPM33555.1 Crp/Fnr family transcriptional regulator [Spirochaetota bacterium]HQE59588.1 Crp/Fnr family transcriptional regulator [Spirochaetota bacterium]HQO21651.1 Crp/Fnr family transcriptional regulator [Spirochaetota bacterium]